MRVKEETEKADLKFNILKTKIMASSPITSWQIETEKVKQWQILLSWAPKSLRTMTAAMKSRRLLLGRKAITNLESTLKSRDIILLTKVHLVKVMAFLVVMHGYKSWTIKKAERQRIDAFELWCWKRLLESPLDCKKSKPVNPKEYQPWIFTERTDAEAPILWPLSKEPTH